MHPLNPLDTDNSEKIQKVLSRLGMGSRRDAETWITQGRVNVNGVPASLGDRIKPSDALSLDGKLIRRDTNESAPVRVLIYNKPEGEICSRHDPEGRPSVFERLPRMKGSRWVNVGRLDINTTGLLLFTTDGELAHRLMHPSYQMDREYAVRVRGEVTDDMLMALTLGVQLDDGFAKFTDIQKAPSGEGVNHWYHCVILEGRQREVRRLWESQGLEVSRLKRVRYGPVFLTADLSVGRYREMTSHEITVLATEVGLNIIDVDTLRQKNHAPSNEKSRRRISQEDRYGPTQSKNEGTSGKPSNVDHLNNKSVPRTEPHSLTVSIEHPNAHMEVKSVHVKAHKSGEIRRAKPNLTAKTNANTKSNHKKPGQILAKKQSKSHKRSDSPPKNS